MLPANVKSAPNKMAAISNMYVRADPKMSSQTHARERQIGPRTTEEERICETHSCIQIFNCRNLLNKQTNKMAAKTATVRSTAVITQEVNNY
jgi:hypothetical protein